MEQKAYTKGQIIIGTFIGGPFAGIYFLKKNFDLMGEKELSKQTIIIGLSIVLLLLAALPVLPESIPGIVYALAYTVLAQGVYFIKQNSLENSPRQSNWNVMAVVILSIITFIIIAVPVLFLYGMVGIPPE